MLVLIIFTFGTADGVAATTGLYLHPPPFHTPFRSCLFLFHLFDFSPSCLIPRKLTRSNCTKSNFVMKHSTLIITAAASITCVLGSPPAPVHIINLNGPVDGPCARIYNRKDYYANQVFCVAQIVTRGKVYRCRGTSTVRPGNTIDCYWQDSRLQIQTTHDCNWSRVWDWVPGDDMDGIRFRVARKCVPSKNNKYETSPWWAGKGYEIKEDDDGSPRYNPPSRAKQSSSSSSGCTPDMQTVTCLNLLNSMSLQ